MEKSNIKIFAINFLLNHFNFWAVTLHALRQEILLRPPLTKTAEFEVKIIRKNAE